MATTKQPANRHVQAETVTNGSQQMMSPRPITRVRGSYNIEPVTFGEIRVGTSGSIGVRASGRIRETSAKSST